MQTFLSSPYRAVLFDMDNTLFDFVESMTCGARAAVAYLGVGTAEELIGYYLRWKHHVEDHTNLQDFMIAHNCFTVDSYFGAVNAFDEAKYEHIIPYPGIPEVLSELKNHGLMLGIVTDAYTYAAEKRLEKSGLKDYFSFVVGYEVTGHMKPHHEPFEHALMLAGCKPYEAVFVGDSLRRDIGPASALGMTAIHARYGDRNFFEPQDGLTALPKTLYAEKPQDILGILKTVLE